MEEGCIVIQTCDKYQPAWENLFWSFNKYWDFEIPWKIYFCNEEVDCKFKNDRFIQIKCGKNNHYEILKIILEKIDHKYIFYMLEDFWPTATIKKNIFMGLFSIFRSENWDSLKLCCIHPNRYSLENTNFIFYGKKILKFSDGSEWRFNQQSSFWKTDVLKNIIVKNFLEEKIKTSLGFEKDTDKEYRKKYPVSKDYIYNLFWYPVGGAYWRGEINLIGQQINFEREVEEYIKNNFI